MNSEEIRQGNGRSRRVNAILGAHRGVGVDVRRPGEPLPTKELPKSEGKVAELERRAAAGQHLFHPRDAKGPD